jgi:1-acyl-sn-glycerol-3-phosphate acyltransferase
VDGSRSDPAPVIFCTLTAVRTPFLDLCRPGVRALARLYLGLRLEGAANIPSTGPVVIAPNHQTYADPVLVTIPIRRPVYYMAWSRLFDVRGLRWLIRRLRAFPVDIDSRDPRAAREAVRLLQSGAAVMIFPEGARSLDGRIGRFKTGAFRLAVSVDAPVLPVTITGGHAAWPPGRALPRPGRMTITYHPLLYPKQAVDARDAARDLSERTRVVIAGAT